MSAHPTRRGTHRAGQRPRRAPAAPVAAAGRDLAGIPFPSWGPDEVADAALAGLCLGEVVCVPGLQSPSTIGTSRQGDHPGGPCLPPAGLPPPGDACKTLTFQKGLFR
jgi:hypothetical protein